MDGVEGGFWTPDAANRATWVARPIDRGVALARADPHEARGLLVASLDRRVLVEAPVAVLDLEALPRDASELPPPGWLTILNAPPRE